MRWSSPSSAIFRPQQFLETIPQTSAPCSTSVMVGLSVAVDLCCHGFKAHGLLFHVRKTEVSNANCTLCWIQHILILKRLWVLDLNTVHLLNILGNKFQPIFYTSSSTSILWKEFQRLLEKQTELSMVVGSLIVHNINIFFHNPRRC